jgi:hypothetical protein
MDSTPSASLPLSFSGGDGDMDEGDAPEAAGTRPVDELIVHNSNIYHN